MRGGVNFVWAVWLMTAVFPVHGQISPKAFPGTSREARDALPARTLEERLAWQQRTLGEAYQAVGSRSATWDDDAMKALDAFAKVRTPVSEDENKDLKDLTKIITNSVRAAIAAGCDDPLVQYLQFRYAVGTSTNPVAYAAEFSELAERMNMSRYHPIRRFYASLRAAEASVATLGPDRKPSLRLQRLRTDAVMHLVAALRGRSIPAEEAFEALREWIPTGKRTAITFPTHLAAIASALETRVQDPPILLARAECAITLAWHARGEGTSDTVTEAGWKLFSEHLRRAQSILEQAWQDDPKDERAATRMIVVCLGLEMDRPEMEKWFSRAMTVNTQSYAAASAKLNYLLPK
jgi:hypothetical protein